MKIVAAVVIAVVIAVVVTVVVVTTMTVEEGIFTSSDAIAKIVKTVILIISFTIIRPVNNR